MRNARAQTLVVVLTALGFLETTTPVHGADPPPSAVEIHEWSIWVGQPSQPHLNTARAYRNAMPSVVGTSRPKADETDRDAQRFAVAPITVVQAFGGPTRDVDIDLRVKKGTLLAHWPPGSERGGRIQWFKTDLVTAPATGVPQAYLPENHWFQSLRALKPALDFKLEARAERFLAYDTELVLPVPVTVRGGPDEYTIQNRSGHRLFDVAVIAPTDNGFRVGWLDELPSATSATAPMETDAGKAARKSDSERADALFNAAETKKAETEQDEPPARPLPPEADADIKARVDQILNRPITLNVESAARKDVLDLIASQSRLRYELDDRALLKAKVNLAESTSLRAAGLSARDALAELLGPIGLSYRVTEAGTLFITTAARLAEEAGKKGAVIEGPPVKITLSQPLKPAHPSYRELTRDAYTRRLLARELRPEVIPIMLDQYAQALFEPDELIVLAHLSRDAIDEAVQLDVFPEPKKLVRIAVVIVHGVDPRLQDRARTFVQQLGDRSPKAREAAEARLFELGPAAVPALEDALRNQDLEIVFRAERLLLKLNRPVP